MSLLRSHQDCCLSILAPTGEKPSPRDGMAHHERMGPEGAGPPFHHREILDALNMESIAKKGYRGRTLCWFRKCEICGDGGKIRQNLEENTEICETAKCEMFLRFVERFAKMGWKMLVKPTYL